MLSTSSLAFLWATLVAAHGDHHAQTPISGPLQSLWYSTLPGDGGTQADSVFSGISTFGRLPYAQCLSPKSEAKYDIAFIGAPFDTGTSYRPGARFGPSGIRQGSRRLNLYGGYNVPLDTNPFDSWATVLDCGDIPVTSYDNTWALHQIEEGHHAILSRAPATDADKLGPAKKGKTLPRVITLGGDHTITLPLLRSINRAYGPVSVIHFDSHLDTWRPKVFGGSPSEVASINHGTYFYHAAQEGLLKNDTNIHAGIRTTLSGPSDYENDGYCGFEIVEAREIDTIGTEGIIKKIRDRVGTEAPVYLSLDIDTLDPAFAPATGTPETGGWSTRELRTILRGLDGLNLIAADIVEVAPAYDTNAEHTTMAAADALYEIMSIMVKRGPLSTTVKQIDESELNNNNSNNNMTTITAEPCIPLAADHPAPSQGPVKRRPGFDYIKPVDSPHEQSVLAAGYPWVRTNILESWRNQISTRGHPGHAEIINSRPHSLNLHSHHGRNTHFLVEGDLLLERESFHHHSGGGDKGAAAKSIALHDGRTYPKSWLYYAIFGAPQKNLEAPVGPGDIYKGTTEYDCAFVEGHRCLSPTTAMRYIDRGTLTWVNKDGRKASRNELEVITGLLASAQFEKEPGSRAVKIKMEDGERISGEMEQWFKHEWVGEDLELMPSLGQVSNSTSSARAARKRDQVQSSGLAVTLRHPYLRYFLMVALVVGTVCLIVFVDTEY